MPAEDAALFSYHAEVGMAGETKNKTVPHGVAGAPNESALLSLMERTGYSMIQENGQRKYGGPPPFWDGPVPPRGCEVFVGKIPRDCYEDELVPVFEKIGKLYELRLMMDFSGTNRGYCFTTYSNRRDALRCVRDLNNYEIRKGRFLGVCLSVDNCRLFVGGIPKNKQKEEILQEMQKVTDGVVDVIVYPSAQDKTKNRGFAFVEYESHRAAAMARRKLIPGRIQLWGHQIAVDWAEPEQEVDEEVMSKVKILYVRNLMLGTTEETIGKVFNEASGTDGAVERVKKIRDYAFVHFKERDDALTAMKFLNGTSLDGSMIEVVLAKPVDKNDYVRYTRGGVGVRSGSFSQMLYEFEEEIGQNITRQPSYAASPFALEAMPGATPFYGQITTAPGAVGIRYPNRAVSYRNPFRGGRGAAGSRGAGGVGRGYMRAGTYRKYPHEEHLYDILPGMELTPTNPITLKPQSVKSAAQVLDEFCTKNGWGTPIYQLHSTIGRDGSGDIQLFLFKISVPALANSCFQPNKLCRTVEEAKNFAAEHCLMQLGVGLGGSECASMVPVTGVGNTPPGSPYEDRAIAPAYSLTNGIHPGAAVPPAHSDLTYACTSVPIVTTTSYAMANAKIHPTTGSTPLQPPQTYSVFPTPMQASYQPSY